VKTTSKESLKKPKQKKRGPSVNGADAKLGRENKQLKRERDEALEREAATSAILRMIAGSPSDIQPILDMMAEYAARLCGADDAVIRRVEGDALVPVAHFGSIRLAHEIGEPDPIGRGGLAARVVREGRTFHVHDLRVAETEFPGARERGVTVGVRTALGVPLLKDGNPLGLIHIRRLKVQPFTEKQIRLVETFADQAVIAIENVRLFKELQERNRDLTEALEQQTATSEILSVISASPADAQPVFDTIVKNATQLCDSSGASVVRYDGQLVHLAAQYNVSAENRDAMQGLFPRPPTREFAVTRAVLDSGVVHIPDRRRDSEFRQNLANPTELQAFLAVPLLRDGRPVGAIGVNRSHPGPFTEETSRRASTRSD